MSKQNRPGASNQPPLSPAELQAAAAAHTARRTTLRAARLALLQKLEAERGARVIAYVTASRRNLGAQVGGDVIRLFRDQLDKIGKVDSLDLFLITRGGDAMAPLRLVSLLREFAKRVAVLVPYTAHSAGSLIALGADEILMGAMGELGPVDPSVTNPFNPIQAEEDIPGGKYPDGLRPRLPISVEDVTSYLTLASDRAKLGPDGMATAFAALTSEVSPLALGNILRNHLLIRHLARRLLSMHMDPATEGKAIDAIVETLTEKLYAHNYLLTRSEAKQIGLKVASPTDAGEGLLWDLVKEYEKAVGMDMEVDFNAILGASQRKQAYVETAVIESTAMMHAFCYKGLAERAGGPNVAFNNEFQGWEVS